MAGDLVPAEADAGFGDDPVTLAELFPTVRAATPLRSLATDAATKAWFDSAGFTTWSDISCMALDEVRSWPNLGERRVDQFVEDLMKVQPASTGPRGDILRPAAPGEIGGSITLGQLFPSINSSAHIPSMVKNVRARNAINRQGLAVWAQIAPLTIEEVRQWKRVGSGSLESLLQDFAAYERNGPAAGASTVVDTDALSSHFPSLDPSTPLHRLTNDTRIINALGAHGVSNWAHLSLLSPAQIKSWPGVGRTSVERLVEGLNHAPLPELSESADVRKEAPSLREQFIVEMRVGGATLRAIGDEFGISPERVRQIIKKFGGPSQAEVRERRLQQSSDQIEKRRASVEEAVRPVLLASGAMSVAELSEATGVTDAELTEFWPSDLEHLRIRTTGRSEQTWSDEDILAAVREAALYEFPLTAKAYADLVRIGQVDGPSLPRVHQRFGGWATACEAAGVEHGKTMRESYNTRWTDKELLAFAREYFLSPDWPNSAHRFDDWKHQHTTEGPSQQTLRNRFGRWSDVKRLALTPEEVRNE